MGNETKAGTPEASRGKFKMTVVVCTFPISGQSGRTPGWLQPCGGFAHAR